MTKRRLWIMAVVLGFAAGLASCGGGGGGGGATPPPGQSSDWGSLVWGQGTWSD
ncbi:MAG: hypothetical protein QNJ98_19985 [Planctomycetota bacterium]|nr:hypothetical protein [Planctomycetota bacterium]